MGSGSLYWLWTNDLGIFSWKLLLYRVFFILTSFCAYSALLCPTARETTIYDTPLRQKAGQCESGSLFAKVRRAPQVQFLGGLYLGVSLARSPQKVFFVFYALVAVWYLVAVFNSILQQGQRFGPIFGSSALLLLSLLLSGLLGYQVIRGAECVEDARNMPRLNGLIQEVLGILPRKVNVGETHNIEMEFYLKAPIESQERYEAELRAAGVTVDGNRQISISPSSAVPTCIWSCFFQNSGIQTFNVSLSQIKGGDTKNFIFTHPHDVKVESKVSASLQSVLAIVVSLLSAVAAFIHLFA